MLVDGVLALPHGRPPSATIAEFEEFRQKEEANEEPGLSRKCRKGKQGVGLWSRDLARLAHEGGVGRGQEGGGEQCCAGKQKSSECECKIEECECEGGGDRGEEKRTTRLVKSPKASPGLRASRQ